MLQACRVSNATSASVDADVEAAGVLLLQVVLPQLVGLIPDTQANGEGRCGEDNQTSVATVEAISAR